MIHSAVVEALTQAGFSGIRVKRAPIPPELLKSFPGGAAGKDPVKLGDQTNYFRIESDQGAFGMWLKPYATLDLHGTGLTVADFLPAEMAANYPASLREVASIAETTLLLLWQKLVQRKTAVVP